MAVSVSTSILLLYILSFSFCLTPNLCSSSTTNNPKSLGLISSLKSLCVPITKSIVPSFKEFIILVVSFEEVNLFSKPIFIGNEENLSKAVS